MIDTSHDSERHRLGNERRTAAALQVITDAIEEHHPSKVISLFSGGDDSLTVTTLASKHPAFGGVVHIDTGTGVRETREFVEAVCSREGWPLKVYSAPEGEYERLLFEGHRTKAGVLHQGFPSGPKSHGTMYYYLKQRQIRQAMAEAKSGRMDRIGFIAGIRVSESDRRQKTQMARPHYKAFKSSAVWIHPLLDWTKQECLDFLQMEGVGRNPVSINCHRSGECLCGALAGHHELGEISFFYPEVGRRFAALSARLEALGLPHQWAGGPKSARRRSTARSTTQLPLCTSCIWGEEPEDEDLVP